MTVKSLFTPDPAPDADAAEVPGEAPAKPPAARTYVRSDINSRSAEDAYFGNIDLINDEMIEGWAARGPRSTGLLKLEVFLDEHLAGVAYTSFFRADVAAACEFPCNAGFQIRIRDLTVPPELAEHASELTLSIRIASTDRFLPCAREPKLPAGATPRLMTSVQKPPPRADSARRTIVRRLRALEPTPAPPDVKIITFYLPQYHPIPENDEWWGSGFTEWSNVTRARPLFDGHQQPKLPADLGFYDLRLSEVLEQQAELATEHGIHGFCFYYYWFNGRRLLEKPLERFLETQSPNLPFCVCWANETWSRRWDGSHSEVLLEQKHTVESDIRFIDDLIPILSDPRYIRVDGVPILILYRPQLVSEPLRVTEEWRRRCREAGLGGLHVCAVLSFGLESPAELGFDSAVQFPPHGVVADELGKSGVAGLSESFTGKLYEYSEVVHNSVRHLEENPNPQLFFPGVMPGWDNTPRKGRAGNVFHGSTPQLYETWLRAAVRHARKFPKDRRLVFVNAWNEWAEGAYLEPDQLHGRAYLHATRRAHTTPNDWRLLLAEARRRGTLTGENLLETLDALESILAGQENSLRYLSRRLAPAGDGASSPMEPARFHAHAPADVLALSQTFGGRAEIERFGPFFGTADIFLTRDECAIVRGWAIAPGVPSNPNTRLLLVLESADGAGAFYAMIRRREAREDVALAFQTLDEDVTAFPGFTVFARFDDVPEGRYYLKIFCPADGTTIVTPVRGSITVLPSTSCS